MTHKLWYQSESVTLYLGDCRHVLADLPSNSVDLIVTDPPYGAEWQSARRDVGFDKLVGDDRSLDVPTILSVATSGALRNGRHVYVFGYSPDDLREPLRLGGTADLVWDKLMPGLGDLSIPWAPAHERITFGVHTRSKANRERGDGRLAARMRDASVLRVPRLNSRGVKRHPTEKPVALMRMLIESSSICGDVVLDPFAGSGATLVAAVLAGRRVVGIEISEQYVDIAAQRVRMAEHLAAQMADV